MVAYLLRGDLRRRWPTALLLALLVMVVVGIVLASMAGARRSRSAFDRYLVDLRGPGALAIGPQEAVEPLEEAAGVVALLPFDLVAAFPSEVVGEDFYPMAVSLDGRVPYDYFRIPVVEGRQADASEPLEVVLSERTAVRLGRDVGDRLPIQTYEPGPDGAEPDPGAEPDGPSLELTVVGIARDPGDIGGRAADLTLTFLTPAFRERFGPDAIGSLASGSFVVLQDGTDLTSLAAEANDLGVELDSSFSSTARQQAGPTMAAIANALYVFAGVAGLAGLAAFAHAVTRTQQTAARDDRALLALGLHRHQRMARLAGPAAVAVVGGTGLGLGLALAVSPMFPVGLARRAEPSLGVQVDGMVLAVGGAGALVVGLGIVIGTTALATRRPGRRPVRTSRFGRLLSDAGLSPAVVTGAALGGRGGGSVGPAAVGGV
ncbi:MAG TPA: ABC transporter permease, partial [Acidimicrobiales bacterium]|nr:ABC transporter permease [Acidimicrobiales bacterium]